ncbi:MAG: ATP-binding protein [Sulfuricella sp.]|nr:ATP-binding protein [Sulfuricella sp.]
MLNFPHSIRSASFRWQLTATVALGILCLALLSSLATSWRVSGQIHDNQVEQGRHVAENLAKHSVLALLYASPDDVAEVVASTLAYPDVAAVEVRTAQGKLLAAKARPGYPPRKFPAFAPEFGGSQSLLEQETSGEWRFVAPVVAGNPSSSPFEMDEHAAETLGFVRVVQTKAALSRLERDVFAVNLGISLFFALVFIVILGLLTGRLTRPLADLSERMALAELGQPNVRAEVKGPRDISDMAHAFNSMMAALETRKEALRAAHDHLEREEAKFHTVADYAYDWEYWIGPRQEILYISPSCERITGYAPAAFVADPGLLQDIVHPEDRAILDSHLENDAFHNEMEVSFRIVRRDGKIRWIAHGCQPVHGLGGEYLGRRVSDRDITERKLAEEALRANSEALQRSNADLEQFAYSVSHDMRQPLRAVSGHLRLLEKALKGRLGDDDRENMAFALDGAQRMDAMIVSLLEYSRVGRKTESKAWLASREPLDEALGFLAPVIAEAGAAVDVSGEWPQVFASRDELVRLFQNLVGNAVKYHEPERPPRVAVDSAVADGRWRVSVRDHGIGIDPRQIDRLFQFFSRLQSRARFEGTGMGLALCRRIVEHHAGRIWVESAGIGQGSDFVFEMPVRADEECSL